MGAFCLGPTGSGKTILLKKLAGNKETGKSETFSELVSKTLATVGVNHFNVPIIESPPPPTESKALCGRFAKKEPKQKTVSVKELGGALAENWLQYLKNADASDRNKILFLIDISDTARISEICCCLIPILHFLEENGNGGKLLIVYSKSDLLSGNKKILDLQLQTFSNVLRLPHIRGCYEKTVDLQEVVYSGKDDSGLSEIRSWLANNCQ